jgi:hypothetical protein
LEPVKKLSNTDEMTCNRHLKIVNMILNHRNNGEEKIQQPGGVTENQQQPEPIQNNPTAAQQQV